jgi:hypothetical protein
MGKKKKLNKTHNGAGVLSDRLDGIWALMANYLLFRDVVSLHNLSLTCKKVHSMIGVQTWFGMLPFEISSRACLATPEARMNVGTMMMSRISKRCCVCTQSMRSSFEPTTPNRVLGNVHPFHPIVCYQCHLKGRVPYPLRAVAVFEAVMSFNVRHDMIKSIAKCTVRLDGCRYIRRDSSGNFVDLDLECCLLSEAQAATGPISEKKEASLPELHRCCLLDSELHKANGGSYDVEDPVSCAYGRGHLAQYTLKEVCDLIVNHERFIDTCPEIRSEALKMSQTVAGNGYHGQYECIMSWNHVCANLFERILKMEITGSMF